LTRWRPTVAEVDLGAIAANCRALRGLLRPGTAHLQVVKANAYGHGDVAVASACVDAGVDRLGVALVEEGVRLRDAGIDVPILVLGETHPSACKEVVAHRLTPSISTLDAVEALATAAAAYGERLPVHVVVDTGMHREGAPPEQALDLVRAVVDEGALELEGLWSHLAAAEEPDHPSIGLQVRRFQQVCEEVEAAGVEVPVRHLANSAATIARPDSHLDMVRTGIACYGLYPADRMRSLVELRPAMRVTSAVGLVRRVRAGEGVSYGLTWAPSTETTIATVPIGYADGFARPLSNRGCVLVGGKRRRVAGTVTMDTIMVDCGDDEVAPGDEVVLLGRQGAEEITADEIAAALGTISYEVVCSVGARVPRVHLS